MVDGSRDGGAARGPPGRPMCSTPWSHLRRMHRSTPPPSDTGATHPNRPATPATRRVWDHPTMKQNREQRRKQQFGTHRPDDEARWPTSAPNPVFGETEAPDKATTGRPDQDQTAETGPGTGGATE